MGFPIVTSISRQNYLLTIARPLCRSEACIEDLIRIVDQFGDRVYKENRWIVERVAH